MEALDEERKKKGQEDKLRQEVVQLVAEVEDKMKKRQYEQAQILFSEILARDPENPNVVRWKSEIDEYNAKLAQDARAKEVREAVNQRAWIELKRGLALQKAGKFRDAIPVFRGVPGFQATDPAPAAKAKAAMSECKEAIKALRDPLLAEAKQTEASGELTKAFGLYKKASLADPDFSEGYAGMARIRKTLHDRAKVSYTEAVLAESYSDFPTARKKYKECLEIAPDDDIYYERANRKLARWAGRPETQTQ